MSLVGAARSDSGRPQSLGSIIDAVFRWLRTPSRIIRKPAIMANMICRLRGHAWDEWIASPLSVPANVPPAERLLDVVEATRWCWRCHTYESRLATEAEQEQAIAEYLAEAANEWADPRNRRYLKWRGDGSQN